MTVLKVALMIAPALWMVRRVHWTSVAERVAALGVLPFIVSASLIAATVGLFGIRWHALLRAYDASPLPKRRALVWHSFVAIYFGMLPGGVAGDLLRAHRVRASVDGTAMSLVVVMFERVLGVVVLFALATAGGLCLPRDVGSLSPYLRVGAVATGVIAIAGIGVPIWVAKSETLQRFVARLPVVGAPLARLRAPRRWRPVLEATALSFVIHLSTLVSIVTLVHAVAPDASLAVIVALTPLVMLLSFVPLTPGGFGQREAIFVELYGLAGVSPDAAVAASLLWFAGAATSGAIGLVLGGIERLPGERSSV